MLLWFNSIEKVGCLTSAELVVMGEEHVSRMTPNTQIIMYNHS